MSNKSLRTIAQHYCIEDLSGASIPHARLQKILKSLECGDQLTKLSLDFLQQQGLQALHRLAIGEVTYASFLPLAVAEQAMRRRAATTAKLARETSEREREADRAQRQASEREREADRAQRQVFADLQDSARTIAWHYCVEDLPGAILPNSHLQEILRGIRCAMPIPKRSLEFLQEQGLQALYRLAIGEVTYDSFRPLAIKEQIIRFRSSYKEQTIHVRSPDQAKFNEQAIHVRSPDQAKIQNQALRARYGLDTFIEPPYFRRLMRILKDVDAEKRLDAEDVVWLSTLAKEYFTDELRMAYHRLEASFLSSEFHRTRDPWAAINASSHHRKCGQAHDAHTLLSSINLEPQPPKIQAALCTTHGGALRDLKRWDEALRMGERAHTLQPKDYRPCTLLGAIYMETGRFDLGQQWYNKAIERGAEVNVVDREIRAIFLQLPEARRKELGAFLLQQDPSRFAWVNKKFGSGHRRE